MTIKSLNVYWTHPYIHSTINFKKIEIASTGISLDAFHRFSAVTPRSPVENGYPSRENGYHNRENASLGDLDI